jgi:NAD(P)-dependent dehydrogenase (short-subunit alcohol dehydrogenase family)
MPEIKATALVTGASRGFGRGLAAGQLIDRYRPGLLVLNAGATPLPRAIQRHTWETFGRNWEVDVQHAFHWVREALLVPLAPGSTVITMSSGAALGSLRDRARRYLRGGLRRAGGKPGDGTGFRHRAHDGAGRGGDRRAGVR